MKSKLVSVDAIYAHLAGGSKKLGHRGGLEGLQGREGHSRTLTTPQKTSMSRSVNDDYIEISPMQEESRSGSKTFTASGIKESPITGKGKFIKSIPRLAINRRSCSTLEDHLNEVFESSSKKKTTGSGQKPEVSFYRSARRGEPSIYEQILSNIRLTKRADVDSPSSKKKVKSRISRSIEKSRHRGRRAKTVERDSSAGKLRTSSIGASQILRSHCTFAMDDEGCLIFPSDYNYTGTEVGELDLNAVKSKQLGYPPDLSSERRRTYVYKPRVDRSYQGIMEHRRKLLRQKCQTTGGRQQANLHSPMVSQYL